MMGYTQDRQKRAVNVQEVGEDGLCTRCDGTGNELYSGYRKCEDCRGTGLVRVAQAWQAARMRLRELLEQQQAGA